MTTTHTMGRKKKEDRTKEKKDAERRAKSASDPKPGDRPPFSPHKSRGPGE